MFPLFSHSEGKRPEARESEKDNQKSTEHQVYRTHDATIICERCGKEAVPLHLGCRLCEDCCDCRPLGT